MRIYTRNLNLLRRSAKRLLQIQAEAVHGRLKEITTKLGELDLSRAENVTAEVLGYLHRADLAACHGQQAPSLLDEELDNPEALHDRHVAQAQRIQKIWSKLTVDEANMLIQAWRPSAQRAVFDPDSLHPERYCYRTSVTHCAIMSPLGQWYLTDRGALMRSPKRPQVARHGITDRHASELRLAMLFDPYDGRSHIELYLGRTNRPFSNAPDMTEFLHRAWTKLGVPDVLAFKTPDYGQPMDLDGVLFDLPKRLGVTVERGQWHIEHVLNDPMVPPALNALDRALREANNVYAYPQYEAEDVEWVWHEANLVLLGSVASEEFPSLWRQHGSAAIVADHAQGRQRLGARPLDSAWLDGFWKEAPRWALDPEYCVYNFTNAREWAPHGVGVNTDPEDIYRGLHFLPPEHVAHPG